MHLTFSGALPIYHTNVCIREQSTPNGKTLSTCLHHCATRVCSMRLTDRNIPFCQTLSGDLQHPFYPCLSLISFQFSFFKKRCHLFKNHLLECRLLIHRMLPVSHLLLPLRNQNLPRGVWRNLPDFTLHYFLHAWVLKEDPSFEQQLTV